MELGIRNIEARVEKAQALCAREGAGKNSTWIITIRATAGNAGYLDIKLVPETPPTRSKSCWFLDVGGRWTTTHRCLSAKPSSNIEYYYFHNFIYESVWKNNRLRHAVRRFRRSTTCSTMARTTNSSSSATPTKPLRNPQPGGGVRALERGNRRHLDYNAFTQHYKHAVWDQPTAREHWTWTQSIKIVRELVDDRIADDAFRARRRDAHVNPNQTANNCLE